jgi:hypothetical protein
MLQAFIAEIYTTYVQCIVTEQSGYFRVFLWGGEGERCLSLCFCVTSYIPKLKYYSCILYRDKFQTAHNPEWSNLNTASTSSLAFFFYFLLHNKPFPFIDGNSRLVYCSVFLVPETLFQWSRFLFNLILDRACCVGFICNMYINIHAHNSN